MNLIWLEVIKRTNVKKRRKEKAIKKTREKTFKIDKAKYV